MQIESVAQGEEDGERGNETREAGKKKKRKKKSETHTKEPRNVFEG